MSRLLKQWPLAILLAVMTFNAMRTRDAYLMTDDFIWMRQTVADAHRPWVAFTGPQLFGNYYRPIPQLVWMANYYLWGFSWGAHQFAFIMVWMLCAVLVYWLGCRLGGRLAGIIAATAVGLDLMYLQVASWKSWYTTLVEYIFVLAWAIAWTKWLATRRKGAMAAWIVLGVLAILSRELAPLIISAGIFVTYVVPRFRGPEKKRGWLTAGGWMALTAAVLLIHPAYRAMAKSALGFVSAGDQTQAAQSASNGMGFLTTRFIAHTDGMLGVTNPNVREFFLSNQIPSGAILRYLALFAVIVGLTRRARDMFSWRALLGLIAISLTAIWLLNALSAPWDAAALLALFLISAASGDDLDRFLGAWFIVAFVPILFLEHTSGAYHLLAETALALYVGRQVSLFAAADLKPVWQELRGRGHNRHDPNAMLALAGLMAILLALQALMSGMNLYRAGPTIAARMREGKILRAVTDKAVADALRTSTNSSAWIDTDDRPAMMAGVLLAKRAGFTVYELQPSKWVGLRSFDSRLRVYTDAVEYDDEVFRACNLYPDPGFDKGTGKFFAAGGRTPPQCLTTAPGSTLAHVGMTASIPCKAGGYVFGGFLRVEAEACGVPFMVFKRKSSEGYEIPSTTAPEQLAMNGWRLSWECAAPTSNGDFTLTIIEATWLKNGRILADDVFLCRVDDLAKKGTRPKDAELLLK